MGWRSGQTYSSDLRGRVLAAVDGGTAAGTVATLFSVSVSYVYKALSRRRPDVTLDELRAWLLTEHGLEASIGLMHDTLVRLGLTLKKSPDGRRSRTAPTSPSSAPLGSPRRAS